MSVTEFEQYDDIVQGAVKTSRQYQMGLKDIVSFAEQWNPEPFHLDEGSAQARGFDGIFASGVHLLAICVKLCNEIRPLPEFVAGLAWDEVRFLKPVYPQQQVHVEMCCIDKRRSNTEGRAVLQYEIRLMTDAGDCALQYKVKALACVV